MVRLSGGCTQAWGKTEEQVSGKGLGPCVPRPPALPSPPLLMPLPCPLQPSLALVAENGYWIRASGMAPGSGPGSEVTSASVPALGPAGAALGPSALADLGGWEPAVSHADFSWMKIALPILRQYQVQHLHTLPPCLCP